MLSKNKWATSGFQRLLISLQNGTATFFKSDCQMFRVDNNLYAGRQAHQIIRIGQRIRFVEVIDTPGQPTLVVTPSSKTADMQIAYRQYFGGITQVGTYFRPKLSPPVKRPAEKEERAFSHLLVLQSQVSFDDGRTTAHPVFVALGRLMNIHFSAGFMRSSNHRRCPVRNHWGHDGTSLIVPSLYASLEPERRTRRPSATLPKKLAASVPNVKQFVNDLQVRNQRARSSQ